MIGYHRIGATAIEFGGPTQRIAIPGSQPFSPRGYQDYSRSIRRLGALPTSFEIWVSQNKTHLLMGGALLVGLGVGYWLGKRK